MDSDTDVFTDETSDEDEVKIATYTGVSRYGLRMPRVWLPVSYGLVPLHDSLGRLGLFDPSNHHWYRRLKDSSDLCCAYDVFNLGYRMSSLECGGTPASPRHNHEALAVHDLVELRYRLCLRALFAALRCDITTEELNVFAIFVYNRLFPNGADFAAFRFVPEFLSDCALTGYIFPGDRVLYPSRTRIYGMRRLPLTFGRALLRFISYVEWVHFRQLEPFTWSVALDCPTVVDGDFPSWGEAFTFRGGVDHLSECFFLIGLHCMV